MKMRFGAVCVYICREGETERVLVMVAHGDGGTVKALKRAIGPHFCRSVTINIQDHVLQIHLMIKNW